MRPLLYLLVAFSGAGLILSAVVHGLTWSGLTVPDWSFALHLGVLLVSIPTVVALGRLSRVFQERNPWRAAFRGAPWWAERALKLAGSYFLLVFLFLAVSDALDLAQPTPTQELRMFSAGWMALYGVALTTFYSALHSGRARRA